MDKEFDKAIGEARDCFVISVNNQGWIPEMRTAAENLLVIYDQMRERLAISTHNGWIRVEDGLPPQTDKYYYWLYSESIDNYEQGEYDYDRKCFVDKVGDRLSYVSHWKLPTPPSDKQTK